jgi:hypothetical protein
MTVHDDTEACLQDERSAHVPAKLAASSAIIYTLDL